MKRIVCDTGPLVHLFEANLLDLLAAAGKVLIPPGVADELGGVAPELKLGGLPWLVTIPCANPTMRKPGTGTALGCSTWGRRADGGRGAWLAYRPAGFIFTVGLWQRYRHPEILLFGQGEDPRGLAGTIQAIAPRIASGEAFSPGRSYEGIFNGRAARFRTVAPRWYPLFLGTAMAFYEHTDFPALELFWPDSSGHFPWEQGFPAEHRPFQPLLYLPLANLAYLPPDVLTQLERSGEPGGIDFTAPDLFIDLPHEASQALLGDWRWLTGDEVTVWRVTVFGDLFLKAPSDCIYRLDCGWGTYEEVAPNEDEWRIQAAVRGADWHHLPVLLELREMGVELEPGQVYSWRQDLMAGGAETVDNVDRCDAAVHVSVAGQFAYAIRDLPPGARITESDLPPLDGSSRPGR